VAPPGHDTRRALSYDRPQWDSRIQEDDDDRGRGAGRCARRRLLAALDEPAGWPRVAEDLCADDVVWRCPARGRVLVGRSAVLAQWRADAALLGDAPCVTLRHAVAGPRAIHESAATLRLPPHGVAGLALAGGARVELGRTRLVPVRGGRIVEELVLETWTPLPAQR
jgi:hypothetical protein